MDVEKLVLSNLNNVTEFSINSATGCSVSHAVNEITTSRIGTFTLPYLTKGLGYEVLRND